jgi:AraC-like DNA-binding protein
MPRTTEGSARPHPPVITTLLRPAERPHVDALSDGSYHALHRESLDDAVRDLRERRARVMLVSVARCEGHVTARLAGVVREFPQAPAVAILTGNEVNATQALLALGRSGVRTLVDARTPVGWRELRDVLQSEAVGAIERVALARLALDLATVSEDCWLFFETVFRESRTITTVRALARRLGVLPSTLVSRFYRLNVPPPKRYLAYVRLMRAARLFENPGMSIASVAYHLDYSSPQSFGRHLRIYLEMSAGEFRRRYDGEGMLERFRSELVLPYLPQLSQLRPLAPNR